MCCLLVFFFFKQKTAYEMRISDWSSDVCSSDLTLFNEHRFQGKVTDILTTVGSHLVTDSLDAGGALLLEAFVAARRDPEVRRLVQGVLDLRQLGRASCRERVCKTV